MIVYDFVFVLQWWVVVVVVMMGAGGCGEEGVGWGRRVVRPWERGGKETMGKNRARHGTWNGIKRRDVSPPDDNVFK